MAEVIDYYNDIDDNVRAWQEQMIAQRLVPPAAIDGRSIVDVKGHEIERYTRCHFFAGILGWIEALRLAGWPLDMPVWTASCPCQPFSCAGEQRGEDDERHLWPALFRLIRERRPDVVFGEQVANAISHGWLDGISTDLETEGYAVGAVVLGAHSVGAPQSDRDCIGLLNGYPTPMAGSPGTDEYNPAGNTDSSRKTTALFAGYPTPNTGDGERGARAIRGENLKQINLVDIAIVFGWGSPRACDAKGSGPENSKSHLHMLNRGYLCAQAVGVITSSFPVPMEKRGALNPGLSRWLMGYRRAWCDCAVMAMRLSRKSRLNSSKRLSTIKRK